MEKIYLECYLYDNLSEVLSSMKNHSSKYHGVSPLIISSLPRNQQTEYFSLVSVQTDIVLNNSSEDNKIA